MDEFSYLMTMSTEPQASWSPGTNNDSPCDTPFSLTIIWLETHAQADHRPWDSLYTHLAFKNARLCQKLNFAESLWGAWDLGEPDPPVSLHGPAVNLSLLQTTTFWFVRPHYGQGTGTCSNSWSNETRETYPSIFGWHTAIHTFLHVAFTAIACIFDFRWNTTQINTENIF